MSFFSKLGSIFQAAKGKTPEAVQQARQRGSSRTLWHVLHVVLLLGALAGLFVLNRVLKLDQMIPRSSEFLRNSWLPILFLLLYLLGWMIWGLWRLLRSSSAAADFPDIDQAWQEA